MYKRLYLTTLTAWLIACLAVVGCAQKSTKSAKTSTDTSYFTGDAVGTGPISTDQITITCSTTSGDVLSVALNQAVTWSFNATSTTGGTASIQQITASPMPSGMMISGSTVTFTPRTQADLIGTLTVAAIGTSGTSQSKVFTWQNSGTSTSLLGNGFGGILLSLLPSLLGGITGSTGGLAGLGGLGGFGSLFGQQQVLQQQQILQQQQMMQQRQYLDDDYEE